MTVSVRAKLVAIGSIYRIWCIRQRFPFSCSILGQVTILVQAALVIEARVRIN